MRKARSWAGVAAVAGLATLGVTLLPGSAHAWWRGRVGFGIWVPPVVVAPRPVYVPPPAYYPPPAVAYAPPPRRFWVPPHWEGPCWVPGHWS